MPSTLGRLAILCVVTIAPLASAAAAWTDQTRRALHADCATKCQGNGNTAERCTAYCTCTTRALESNFPDEDDFLRQAEAKGPVFNGRVQGIIQYCNAR